MAERTVLDETLLRMLPLVHEANMISNELSKVSGSGVYCYDFRRLPITPGASCSCVDALNARDSKFILSPAVSRFIQPV